MNKQRLEEDNSAFQKQWTEKLCFVENKHSIICVICKQNVKISEELSLRRHLETKHSDFNQKYSGEFRKQKVTSLVQILKVQQNIFFKKMFRLFRKIHLLVASQKLFLHKVCKHFETISLNQMSLHSRVADI
jgi:hypothetical protein